MKTNIIAKIIACATLSALALSPVVGAPRKVEAAESKKSASSPATSVPAEKAKTSPAQAAARELVAELSTTEKSKMLALLNEGAANELTGIKGVSKTRAAAIAKARPFGSIDEVILVSGIGKKTISEMVTHARGLTTTAKKNPSPTASKKKASPSVSSPKEKLASSASSRKKSKSSSASSVKKEKPAPSASSLKKETKTSSPSSSSQKAKMTEKS